MGIIQGTTAGLGNRYRIAVYLKGVQTCIIAILTVIGIRNCLRDV